MKILIADDNEENLYMLQSLLKGDGHEVFSAHDGIEALDIIKSSGVELIISDILMPNMDGFQLCRAVRGNEDIRNIPFIFYTATYISDKDRDFALSLGADQFFVKPDDMELLVQTIRERIIEHPSANEYPLGDEMEFFRQHNKVLFRKLEKKVSDLEVAKQTLQANLQQMSAILNNIPDMAWLKDTEGRFIAVNAPFGEACGRNPQDVVGKTALDIWPQDLAQLYCLNDQEVMRKEERKRVEERLVGPDGKEAWIETIITPVVNIDGNIIGTTGIARDISERKRAEVELYRLNRELQAVSECSKILVRAEDEKELLNHICTTVCEKAGYRMAWVGYAEQDEVRTVRPVAWAGKEDGYLTNAEVSWADTGRGQGPTGTAIRKGEPIYIQDFRTDPRMALWRKKALQRGYLSSIALPLKEKSGSAFGAFTLYSSEANAFTPDEIRLLEELADDLAFGINVLRTRAERERAEETIRTSEAQLSNALRMAHAGHWEYDVVSDTFTFNDNFYKIFRTTAGEVGGYKMSSAEYARRFCHPDDLSVIGKEIQSMLETTDPNYSRQLEHRIIYNDGEIGYIAMRFFIVKDFQGSTVKSYGVTQDITERKRMETALEENERQLSLILNNVSDVIFSVAVEPGGVFRFSSVNRRFLEVTGLRETQIAGVLVRDIVPATAHALVFQKYDEAIRSRLPVSWEETSEYPSGRRVGHVTVVPVFDPHGICTQLVGMVHDITERKRTEQRIQRQIERFSALRAIDLAISSILNIRVTLQIFIEHAISQLRVDAVSVLLLNPHTRILEYAAGQGFRTNALKHSRLRLGEGYAGTAALENRVINVPDLTREDTGFKGMHLLEGEDFVAYYGVPLVAKGHVKGVLEIFHRDTLQPDEEWFEFLNGLALQAAIATDNNSLFNDLERSNIELSVAYDSTIEGWSRALDYRDKETEGHSQRVTELTMRIAREMGMTEDQLLHVRRGALLHDIGKMGIPDAILLKPGPLSEEEWKVMRLHPVYSYELLYPIAYLRPALDIPYCHHEKWDGSGYPRGLKGEQIPLSARIFAVVDVWDALCSKRPYRSAWSEEKAREHILSLSGIQFDPKVIDSFFKMRP